MWLASYISDCSRVSGILKLCLYRMHAGCLVLLTDTSHGWLGFHKSATDAQNLGCVTKAQLEMLSAFLAVATFPDSEPTSHIQAGTRYYGTLGFLLILHTAPLSLQGMDLCT